MGMRPFTFFYPKLSSILRDIRGSSVLFFLLNAPLLLFFGIGHLNRPIFNLDYLIVIVISSVSRQLSLILLILICLVDYSVIGAAQFHFLSPLEYLTSVRFLTYANFFEIAYRSSAVLLFGVLFLYLTNKILPSTKKAGFLKTFAAASFLCVSVISLDILNGSAPYFYKTGATIAPINVAGSALRIAIISTVQRDSSKIVDISDADLASNLAEVKVWAEKNQKRSVVYVLVESLGESLDGNEDLFIEILKKGLTSKYEIRSELVGFNGSTTSAEMRELCSKIGSYSVLDNKIGANCLPNYFNTLDWVTKGYHGFSKKMFNRSEWWKYIGFQQTFFFEELNSSLRRCGGMFAGICDADLIHQAFSTSQFNKEFIYILTLNSHLPIPSTVFTKEDMSRGECRLHIEVCALEKSHSVVFTQINFELNRIDPLKLPYVVIVGDHSPPFGNELIRNNYSQSKVPKFVLTPKY